MPDDPPTWNTVIELKLRTMFIIVGVSFLLGFTLGILLRPDNLLAFSFVVL